MGSFSFAKQPPIPDRIPGCDDQVGGCDNNVRYDRNFCRVELRYRYGNIIRTFSGSPCNSILNRCKGEILRRHLGQNAYCRIANSNPGRQVTRQCTYYATERNRWGEIISQTPYSARGRASNARQARQRACDRAYQRCVRNRRSYEVCEEENRY